MKLRWIVAWVPLAVGCSDPAGDDSIFTSGADAGLTSTGEGPGGTRGPTAGGGTEGNDGTAAGTATAGETTSPGTGSPPIFDVGTMPDGGGNGCAQVACGESEWSYIWIANSTESTLSKIDTRTLVEEGRYYTRPDHSGNPSRTSVSIDGRAVAVANRMGGVTKIYALPEDCTDANGNGIIDTSAGGAGSMVPFAEEECIAWHTAFPMATTQRPVAWTSGVYNPVTCEYDEQTVWSAAAFGTGGTWPCDGADGIHVYRLDGETGSVLEDVHMPDVTCGSTLGPYGGAVDFNNDLWMYIWSAGTIVHVEFETLNYETLPGGSYGITVDTSGRVWVDSGSRYDPMTGMWANEIGNLPGSGGAGIAQDQLGRMWTATQGGVGWIDMETMVVGDIVPLPEGGLYRGIGVDFDGYIWAVMLGGTTAHKIDPVTYAVDTFVGLNSPYTYSDMAGGQLTSVTCNPPAG
ncbi:MAG: hypothetical protein K0V04_15875 [Deltaproteobacteria bacterium]|nr:hypothetical protein [Deltaproteobacteria bacterium]